MTVETLQIPGMGGWISQEPQWVPLQYIDAIVDLDCREGQGGRAKITVNGLEEHQLVNVSALIVRACISYDKYTIVTFKQLWCRPSLGGHDLVGSNNQ